ncbi:MAG: methyl-accepting chemotaxis protein [Halieaceae bacterium]|nr:methyl-accepting chemotaxis protein [Halieaceae bacterium]
MKVSSTLRLGFGALCLLLLLISAVAVMSIRLAAGAFSDYELIAEDTNLAGRVEANMLGARLETKKYLETRSDVSTQRFDDYLDSLVKDLEFADTHVGNADRRRLLREIEGKALTYQQAFNDVKATVAEQFELTQGQLIPAGELASQRISQIMQLAYEDNDVEAAYRAGLLQESLLLLQRSALDYLGSIQSLGTEQQLAELTDEVDERARILDRELQNPERRRLLQEAMVAQAEFVSALTAVKVATTRRRELVFETLDVVGPQVADLASKVRDSVEQEQDALGQSVAARNSTAMTVLVVLALGAIGLAVFASQFITRSVMRPLGGEPQAMADIAADISRGRLHGKQADQHATGLRASMLSMQETLFDIVSSVREAAAQVYSGAAEIAAGNEELSARTEEQAASLEETASSLEQITATVVSTSSNAQRAKELASSTRELAHTGMTMAERADAAMDSISSGSKQISDIIRVIDEIAFQTNLLALNAAVEAARAGQHGRGFEVVAKEVRNLAERAAVSAREVGLLIERSVADVSEGQAVVSESTQTLHKIVSAIDEVSGAVADIADATTEQQAGLRQISSAVNQMDEVTQQNAAMVEQAAAASRMLEDYSRLLQDRVAFFTLGGSTPADSSIDDSQLQPPPLPLSGSVVNA